MAKFLIEVPHEAEELACARVVKVFLSTGSHFLSQADWGCVDGVHSAWFVVDTDTRDEARRIVPPAFRDQAKIVGLNRFTMEQIDNIMKQHRRAAD
jgi:hypothetical protein